MLSRVDEDMSTDTVERTADRNDRTLGGRLFALVQFAIYGLAAAFGSLAVVTGIRTYLEFADGGVSQPVPNLFGVVVLLGVGWTLVLIALSGAVACGVERS